MDCLWSPGAGGVGRGGAVGIVPFICDLDSFFFSPVSISFREQTDPTHLLPARLAGPYVEWSGCLYVVCHTWACRVVCHVIRDWATVAADLWSRRTWNVEQRSGAPR